MTTSASAETTTAAITGVGGSAAAHSDYHNGGGPRGHTAQVRVGALTLPGVRPAINQNTCRKDNEAGPAGQKDTELVVIVLSSSSSPSCGPAAVSAVTLSWAEHKKDDCPLPLLVQSAGSAKAGGKILPF
ncbi:hypothetical protein MTO96_020341 [Rhipicephalus appendiculatus]